MTSSGRFVPEVDGLRFVAIASVLLFHGSDAVSRAQTGLPESPSWLTILLAGGNAGVPLFFAVSGFVIGLPFAERCLGAGPPVSLRAYFVRRLTRLEPPYLANLLLLAVLLVMTGAGTVGTILTHLVPSLVYQHNLLFGSWSLVNFVAWSLEVEVQFYVLAPLLARVFTWPAGARRMAIAAVVVAASLVNAFVIDPSPGRYTLSLAAWIHFFLIGFLIADLRVTGALQRLRPWVWDLVGAASWALLVPIRLGGPAYPLLFPSVAAVAFAATLSGPRLRALFSNVWLATTGGMCYTIYLYHPTIMHFAGEWLGLHPATGDASRLLATLVLSACSIAVSIPLFLLLEKPFMFRDWPRRLLAAPFSVWRRPGVFGRSELDAGR